MWSFTVWRKAKDLKKHQDGQGAITELIHMLHIENEKHKDAILTYAQFRELFTKLPDIIVKTKVMEEKDYLLKKLFSNCTEKDKKYCQ